MVYYAIYTVGVIALLIQLLLLVSSYRHLRFAIRKYRPRKPVYQPNAAVICPCKGIDTTFDRNINSLFVQDYPDYEIHFVVESTDDPAYARLTDIIAQQQRADGKIKAQITVAGLAKTSAQKVHNLLTVCKKLPDDIKIFAFIDSDACLKKHFLTSLIYPLRRTDAGASTGYRWFVPTDSRLSSKTLSAMNAFFASMLGPHRWNSAWGGAMAIRHELFDKIEMQKVWQNALTDDYTLSYAVKRAGLHVLFAPACFVASYEQTS